MILLYKVAITLSDKNKVDTRILEKISKYDLKVLLLGIEDIECVKKGLPYLNDSYIETIIMQDKYDSKVRFDLLSFIKEGAYKIDIVKTFDDDGFALSIDLTKYYAQGREHISGHQKFADYVFSLIGK